jgi:hypothetical protein
MLWWINLGPDLQIERMYLIQVREPDDLAQQSLALDQVFVVDHKMRAVARGMVSYSECISDETDPRDLILTIRYILDLAASVHILQKLPMEITRMKNEFCLAVWA